MAPEQLRAQRAQHHGQHGHRRQAGPVRRMAMDKNLLVSAHQRLDYTARDDENFLRHSLAYHNATEAPRIDYLDVVITRSKPGVRDYSGAKK